MEKINQYDVIIIGAGAVGLFAGNLLGKSKIKTLIIDKESRVKTGSRAIGITPPSMQLLKLIQLDKTLIKHGVKVKNAVVHGTKKQLGVVDFTYLPSDYPFILSIPQEVTETLLEQNLKKFSSVTLMRGKEAVDFQINESQIDVKAINKKNNKQDSYRSKFLCGCDGKNSFVRSKLKIKYPGGRYRQTFLMADFVDETNFDSDAHLFFTSVGPVESFPLPQGKRRWIVETKSYMENPDKNFIIDEVKKKANIKLNIKNKVSESPFGVQHHLASIYYKNNIVLCGDAAHVMSPIGGQGMNTGFGDAEFCANMLIQMIKCNEPVDVYFKKYNYYRRIAAKTATGRASLSMRIGTLKGFIVSGIRNLLIKYIIVIMRKKVPIIFSMLTIPYGTISKVSEKDKSLFKCDNLKKTKK